MLGYSRLEPGVIRKQPGKHLKAKEKRTNVMRRQCCYCRHDCKNCSVRFVSMAIQSLAPQATLPLQTQSWNNDVTRHKSDNTRPTIEHHVTSFRRVTIICSTYWEFPHARCMTQRMDTRQDVSQTDCPNIICVQMFRKHSKRRPTSHD